MDDMNCREVSEFIMVYLDDELEPSRKEELESHLTLCDDCVEYLRSYERTIELGRAAFDDNAAASSIPEDLVRAIVAARARKS